MNKIKFQFVKLYWIAKYLLLVQKNRKNSLKEKSPEYKNTLFAGDDIKIVLEVKRRTDVDKSELDNFVHDIERLMSHYDITGLDVKMSIEAKAKP